MTFSPSWLELREPADRLARAPELMQMLEGFFSGRGYADVVDLGCGTGSNLRAIHTILPRRQSWLLVDHDTRLLEAAAGTLADWADIAGGYGDSLLLEKDGHSIRVHFAQADLAADPAPWGDVTPDLVTASALFDLVSQDWIRRFTTLLGAARIPLYTSLIYDGRAAWQPSHPSDQAMVAAFNNHQTSDKGFGAACGPAATSLLRDHLVTRGYRVETEESPWMLGEDAEALAAELNRGWADAVRETATVDPDTIDEWLSARLRGQETLVGHNDLLALPAPME